MALSLGTISVDLDANARKFKRQMRGAQQSVDGFAKKAAQTKIPLRDMATAFAVVGASAAGLGLVARKVFQIGSAVEETASKYRTVFGPAVQQTNQFLDEFATQAGLSNQEAQELVATTGAIAQGMGFAVRESASFAQEATRLAADIASFNNAAGGTEQVLRALQSSFAGEREQLKQFGIVIREAEVQQRALTMTGKEAVSALTQQDKATATLALITEKAGVAVGDLARTQDSAANTARRVTARLRNLRDYFASEALPTLAQFVGAMDDSTASMDGFRRSISGAFELFRKFIGGIAILGADAAVWVQEIAVNIEALKAAADQLPFVDIEHDVGGAIEQLERVRDAADETRREIVAGFDNAAESIQSATNDTEEFTQAMERAVVATQVFGDVSARGVLGRAGPNAPGIRGPRPPGGRMTGPLNFNVGGRSGGGRFADLEQIDQAVRATAALADASGELSDEARGAVRGLSDVIGGLQGLQSGELGGVGQIGAAFGIAGGIASFATALFGQEDALDRNTQALRDMTGSLRGEQSLALQRLEALDIEDPREAFSELRSVLSGQFGDSGALGEWAQNWIATLNPENIGTQLAGILEQIQAGTFRDSGLFTQLQAAGVDVEQFIDILTEMERLGDEAGRAADRLNQFTGAFNAVQFGFKYNLAHFQARDFDTPRGSDLGNLSNERLGDTRPNDSPIVVHSRVYLDGRVIAESVEEEGRRQAARGGSGPLTTRRSRLN